MTNEQREACLKEKLNEIRAIFFPDFWLIGRLNICVDCNYISAFSSSHCDGKTEQVNFNVFYNADGTEQYRRGNNDETADTV